MRELTIEEMEQVDGGVGLPGAIISAGYNGVTSIANGDSAGQVLANVGFGLFTGWFGGAAVGAGLSMGWRAASSALGGTSAYLQGRANRAFQSDS